MTNYIGDNVAVQATVTDASGTLVTPSAVTVVVLDPTGTAVTASAPVALSTGVYQAIVAAVAKAGVYTVRWEATVSSFTKGIVYDFTVQDGVPPLALASPSDVEDLWRPLLDTETLRVQNLIVKASARLRQQAPFNIDTRMALFRTDPTNPVGLDPQIVADVVAGAVKRFLVNPSGVVSQTSGTGPYSVSQSFVNRYDKTGTDVRGSLEITESDIDQLRPATSTVVAGSIRMRPGNSVFPLGPAGPVDELAIENIIIENHADAFGLIVAQRESE